MGDNYYLPELETDKHVTKSVDADEGTFNDVSQSYSVPTDYDTVQAALTDNNHPIRAGFNININIESGHVIETPIDLIENYYSHITVTSTDSVVNVGSTFPSNSDIIRVRHGCAGPQIDTKIDAGGYGEDGANVRSGSYLRFQGGNDSGVINAGGNGVQCYHSFVEAYRSDFSGAGVNCVLATRGGIINLGGASPGAVLTGATEAAIRAEKVARVRASNADLSNAGSQAILAQLNADVTAEGGVFDGAGSNAIVAEHEASVTARDSSVADAGGSGLLARQSGSIDAENATVTNAGARAVDAQYAGDVNISGGEASGSSSVDLRVKFGGGQISCEDCTTTNTTSGSPHESDMNISPNTTTGSGWILSETTET